MGSESEPKRSGFGVCVWTQNRFGYGSFPKGLGDGSMARPNRARDWVHARTQGGLGLGHLFSDLMGFGVGYFRVWTQKGVGWVQSLNPRGLSLGSTSGPKIGFGVGLDNTKA
ncbi:hypothetical protein NC651_038300 [Populus alba x Populus x berolinensis]|nr:hypothetical protein NC651_038300 [Populus alba x Populus x berolinensis]